MMNGRIGVQTQVGKGSLFWFTAKLKKQPTKSSALMEPIADVELQGKRILVVDDNKTNRQVMAYMLSSWRCRHDTAHDAESALEKLRAATHSKDPFHIVVMDMRMPDIDGEALGKMVKTDPLIRDTALVMLTSVGKRGDVSRLAKIGFAAYLTKPVKRAQLLGCLLTVIGHKPETDSSNRKGIITRHTVAENRKRSIRILLAEDNVINRKLALKLLENMGYRADVATNGVEAVQAIKAKYYDLVLMDCQMPEMNGLDATRAIRKIEPITRNGEGLPHGRPGKHHIPIIAMTASAMKGDKERCLEAGMNDYVSKPIKAHELAETIERWLENE
jgi:CheY-like chemotaxis protein